MSCPCSNAAFYIRISRWRPNDRDYAVATGGIEGYGYSAEKVVAMVVESLGLEGSPLGAAVRKEVARTQYQEAQRRAAAATDEATRLRAHLEGFDG